jgi:hypothetical protein
VHVTQDHLAVALRFVFADEFAAWKALGPSGEFSSYYFGKDGFYIGSGGAVAIRQEKTRERRAVAK